MSQNTTANALVLKIHHAIMYVNSNVRFGCTCNWVRKFMGGVKITCDFKICLVSDRAILLFVKIPKYDISIYELHKIYISVRVTLALIALGVMNINH